MATRRFTEQPDAAQKLRKFKREQEAAIANSSDGSLSPETHYDYIFQPKDYCVRHNRIDELYRSLPSVRLLLRGADAAKLIGEAYGSFSTNNCNHVLRIRKKYYCDIKLSEGSAFDSERILWLRLRYEDFDSIFEDIIENLNYTEIEFEERDVQLLVPQAYIGCIIGARGDRIKSIRREAHVNITIYRDCLPHSNERSVSIVGKTRQIRRALKIIITYLTERAIQPDAKDPAIVYYEPCKTRWGLPGEYGGFTSDDISEVIFDDLQKFVENQARTKKTSELISSPPPINKRYDRISDYSAVPPDEECVKLGYDKPDNVTEKSNKTAVKDYNEKKVPYKRKPTYEESLNDIQLKVKTRKI